MSQRPTARKSQLTGQSPVRPQVRPEPPVEPSETPEATAETTTSAVTAPAPENLPSGKKTKSKVGFYMTEDDLLRAQRAHMSTIMHTGTRFWTAYLNEAVMAYTKQLEQQHNDSKPF